MAAQFQSFSIDVVPDPKVPDYMANAFQKGPIGKDRPGYLGYENLEALLPYDGIRDVVHRSNFAKTGELVGRVEADNFYPRVLGFESSLERATAISALVNPNTFDLKCQPRKVSFMDEIDGVKSNTLDFSLTLKSGQKVYLYVKNDDALKREVQELIVRQIKVALPSGCWFAVISEASFSPQERGNNERIFLAKRFPDPEADTRLEEVLEDIIDVPEFSIEELVVRGAGSRKCEEQGRIFDAVLRFIADGRVNVDKRKLIDFSATVSRVA